jgi:geranylgeranyl diphosphate synthase, type II
MDGKAIIEKRANGNGNGHVPRPMLRRLELDAPANGYGLATNGYAQFGSTHGATTAAPFLLSVDELHERVESALAEVEFAVAERADRLAEAARYALLAGGKRVRPILVMATAQALGVSIEDALPTACAIEMIHTNSLIVDDLPAMDNHPKRRGRPALHRVYGDDIAILAGCALLSEAQSMILEEQGGTAELRNHLLRIVLQATGSTGMVSGQFLDVTRYRPSSPHDLERTQMLKTGTLVVACVHCGALLGAREMDQALTGFAQSLGVLFQVVDDILDETGKARWLGKMPGSDRRKGKMTNVTMFGLKYARETATALYERCLMHLDEIAACVPGPVAALREIADLVHERNT